MATKKAESMIRIDNTTKAALDILSAEIRLETGKPISQTEAIWRLFEEARPHIADRVRELAANAELKATNKRKEDKSS